jgi:hypothetical protein
MSETLKMKTEANVSLPEVLHTDGCNCGTLPADYAALGRSTREDRSG